MMHYAEGDSKRHPQSMVSDCVYQRGLLFNMEDMKNETGEDGDRTETVCFCLVI